MKRQLMVVFLALGAACAASAQVSVPDTQPVNRNVAADFSAGPTASETLFLPASAVASSASLYFAPAAPAMPSLADVAFDPSPSPSPAPAPDPRFIYGGRDDYRWQLGIGLDWLRFRSSIFRASGVGLNTEVTYFTNEWFGVEGDITTAFAPEIYDHEHVKLLVYGVGPKIAWRQRKWEPWLHAILGGSHEQPQTAGNSRTAFAVEAGGGADYRVNPRFSGRVEADWVHTSFFSQNQNNFELVGSVVFHF